MVAGQPPCDLKQEVKTEPKAAADSEEDWEDAAAATPKPSLMGTNTAWSVLCS